MKRLKFVLQRLFVLSYHQPHTLFWEVCPHGLLSQYRLCQTDQSLANQSHVWNFLAGKETARGCGVQLHFRKNVGAVSSHISSENKSTEKSNLWLTRQMKETEREAHRNSRLWFCSRNPAVLGVNEIHQRFFTQGELWFNHLPSNQSLPILILYPQTLYYPLIYTNRQTFKKKKKKKNLLSIITAKTQCTF